MTALVVALTLTILILAAAGIAARHHWPVPPRRPRTTTVRGRCHAHTTHHHGRHT